MGRELVLGARMAMAGGLSGRVRTGLTAMGVGLGVALFLLAASMPNAIASRAERAAARDDVSYSGPVPKSDTTILVGFADTEFRGRPIRGRLLQPDGTRPPVPPGLAAVPGPGELAVSPALARLLASPGAALLRERLDYPIVATIGDEGLSGPAELAFYLGMDDGDEHVGLRLASFGQPRMSSGLEPILALLVVVGAVVLLLPVGLFVAAATRFGAEARDRRMAAVRLLGADARMTRRIAAGEAFASSVLGVVAGAVFFFIGRSFVDRVELFGLSVFPTDVRPHPVLALGLVVAVPAVAVAVTVLSLRRAVAEPLGVTRRAGDRRRRRLWWRILLPVLGVASLLTLIGDLEGGQLAPAPVAARLVLVLIGVAALLPWAVQATVRHFRGGPVAWQLAVRRLQLDSSSPARAVMGIAVAVAGAIALQTLFMSVEDRYTTRTGADLNRADVVTDIVVSGGWNGVTEIEDALRETDGVESVYPWVPIGAHHLAAPAGYLQLTVADCDVLHQKAQLDSCVADDVFIVRGAFDGPDDTPHPGTIVELESGTDHPTHWTIPAEARVVAGRPDLDGRLTSGVLATPSALPAEVLASHERTVYSYVAIDPTDPDAVERVRNTMWDHARAGLGQAKALTAETHARQFANVRQALFAGATATLVLIGLSLLLTALEQLRERRRVLATLVAFGTRQRTLAWSILWQTLVPVVLGLCLAVVTGVAVGTILLRIVGATLVIDWASVGLISAVAGIVVLAVTVSSTPALWRLMRADGLRTE